jgi:hypothetical protein
VPAWLGTRSENAAHRIAIEWHAAHGAHAAHAAHGAHGAHGANGPRTGVYIPRRDSASVINVAAGGRLFPGEHHRASFDVRETGEDLHVAFASADGTTRVSVDVRHARWLQGSRLFAEVPEASDFFRHGSTGSTTQRSARFAVPWHRKPRIKH